MTRSTLNSKNIIYIVVAIVIAVVLIAFIYMRSRVSMTKAEHMDKDLELAKLEAAKENRRNYYDIEKERSKAKTEILNKAVDTFGTVANTVADKGMDIAADMMKEDELDESMLNDLNTNEQGEQIEQNDLNTDKTNIDETNTDETNTDEIKKLDKDVILTKGGFLLSL